LESHELSIPDFFDPVKIPDIWPVNYRAVAEEAGHWAEKYQVHPAVYDRPRIALLLIDCQNSFCTPGYSLFVPGRSGDAAVHDSRRICEFIYRNLIHLSRIVVSLDTHKAMQIFHPAFLLDVDGKHPEPFTIISSEEVAGGKWRINPVAAQDLELPSGDANLHRYLLHYTRTLERSGKYQLMIWPYHVMFGGVDHALVSSIQEAVFFHTIARQSQAEYLTKGDRPLTENYSVLAPEVTRDDRSRVIAEPNTAFLNSLLTYDYVIIAGQAKSHCVAWTVRDLLERATKQDESFAEKIYLLEDCTSPVVIEGGYDFTDDADAAYKEFAESGVHLVSSVDPIVTWPGIKL